MPSGVFKPYAGVSTAVLFFTKTNSGGTDNVWFYDMKADGYSLDDKRNEIKENDIPDIVARFKSLGSSASLNSGSSTPLGDRIERAPQRTPSGAEVGDEANQKRTEQSFLVPFSEIKENDWDLSINRYKEIVYEEVKYDAPKDIIADIEKLDKQRSVALNNLKEMLK
jgi:type I restriction enzyme M protein